jgi:hypothetical protein
MANGAFDFWWGEAFTVDDYMPFFKITNST